MLPTDAKSAPAITAAADAATCDDKTDATSTVPGTARITVTGVEGLDTPSAEIVQVSWVSGETPAAPVRARVQVRHRHPGALAKVVPDAEGGARVCFEEPVRAVAPGQAAVFYDAEAPEVVLGGGWIHRTGRPGESLAGSAAEPR